MSAPVYPERRDQVSASLRIKYGPCIGRGGYLCVWRRDTKRSRWFPLTLAGLERAAEYIVRERADLYVGVALSDRVRGERERVKNADAYAVVGHFADADVKAGAFPTMVAARGWVANLPKPPTLVICSGGGLQLWWLYPEPWYFASAEERLRWRRMSKGWTVHLRSEGGSGVSLDFCHDLARIGRPAGGLNCKEPEPRPTTIDEALSSGVRYSPDDFAAHAVEVADDQVDDDGGVVAANAADAIAAVVLRGRDLDGVGERFAVLLDLHPLARATWDGRRPDLDAKAGRHDPNRYDQSIANIARQAGLSPQNVADLLRARRLREADPEVRSKADRRDYVLRTLRRAWETPAAMGELWLEAEAMVAETPASDAVETEEDRAAHDAAMAMRLPVGRGRWRR